MKKYILLNVFMSFLTFAYCDLYDKNIFNGSKFFEDEFNNTIRCKYEEGKLSNEIKIYYNNGTILTFTQKNGTKINSAKFEFIDGKVQYLNYSFPRDNSQSTIRQKNFDDAIKTFQELGDQEIYIADMNFLAKEKDKIGFFAGLELARFGKNVNNFYSIDELEGILVTAKDFTVAEEIKTRRMLDSLYNNNSIYLDRIYDNLIRISNLANHKDLEIEYKLYNHYKSENNKTLMLERIENILKNKDYDFSNFEEFYGILYANNKSNKYGKYLNGYYSMIVSNIDSTVPYDKVDFLINNMSKMKLGKNEEIKVRLALKNTIYNDQKYELFYIKNLEILSSLYYNEDFFKELYRYYEDKDAHKAVMYLLNIANKTQRKLYEINDYRTISKAVIDVLALDLNKYKLKRETELRIREELNSYIKYDRVLEKQYISNVEELSKNYNSNLRELLELFENYKNTDTTRAVLKIEQIFKNKDYDFKNFIYFSKYLELKGKSSIYEKYLSNYVKSGGSRDSFYYEMATYTLSISIDKSISRFLKIGNVWRYIYSYLDEFYRNNRKEDIRKIIKLLREKEKISTKESIEIVKRYY